jgi:hypothetical protein
MKSKKKNLVGIKKIPIKKNTITKLLINPDKTYLTTKEKTHTTI